jgi:hypothetical protein
MARKAFSFDIPEPCHEGWENMQPAEKGRYCSSCEKVVVDFTRMTDGELLRYMQSATASVCGRMTESQLSRAMHLPVERNAPVFSLRALVLGTALSAFTALDASAQQKVGKIAPPPQQEDRCPMIIGEMVSTPVTPAGELQKLHGFITGSASGDSLEGVIVMAIDADGNQLAQAFSDARGWYELNGLSSAVTAVHYQLGGYETLVQPYDNTVESLSVTMMQIEMMIEGEILLREE